jgi:hypothetical protein
MRGGPIYLHIQAALSHTIATRSGRLGAGAGSLASLHFPRHCHARFRRQRGRKLQGSVGGWHRSHGRSHGERNKCSCRSRGSSHNSFRGRGSKNIIGRRRRGYRGIGSRSCIDRCGRRGNRGIGSCSSSSTGSNRGTTRGDALDDPIGCLAAAVCTRIQIWRRSWRSFCSNNGCFASTTAILVPVLATLVLATLQLSRLGSFLAEAAPHGSTTRSKSRGRSY